MRTHPLKTLIASAAAAIALAGCGVSEPADTKAEPAASESSAPASESAAPTDAHEASSKGKYVDYADYSADTAAYSKSQVVLFFHAPWCPDCQATDDSLTKDGVPDGITVVKVDYDSMSDLKEKYGVTQQHTFVAIDADGMQAKKWSGTTSGKDIAAQLT